MTIKNATIGADIEWFLQNQKNNEIVSAEGLILGTKSNPYHFDKDNNYFATSLDNVMAEGNIPPAKTPSEFYLAIQKLQNFINESIPKELKTVAIPSARLSDKWLMTENARTFGCDPSLNCWTLQEVRPLPSGDNCRSAGFHIHVGYTEPNSESNIALAKAMDLFLGVPSVLIEPENERKTVGYGLASNFRHQKHGMEYRTLSSYFSSSKDLVEWCYNNTQKAIEFINNGCLSLIEDLGDSIQEIINNEDKQRAESLMKEFNLSLI